MRHSRLGTEWSLWSLTHKWHVQEGASPNTAHRGASGGQALLLALALQYD